MSFLKLNDFGTRRALRAHGLVGKKRIGRGTYCAVYDDGEDAVLKLTADYIQLESVQFYLDGVHFPRLMKIIGRVGIQDAGNADLYLFQAERLKPTSKADAPTRKLAKRVIDTVQDCLLSKDAMSVWRSPGAPADRQAKRSLTALKQLVDTPWFPESLKEAFEKLQTLSMDYGNLSLDFHRANLMVRGSDELVLNDVIASSSLGYS